MKGAYLLILENGRDANLTVGYLGALFMKKGFYVYVGSAKAGIEKRVRRYLEGPSRVRWHIDYLVTSPYFKIRYVIKIEGGDEVEIAKRISSVLPGIERFGSSDDRENRSHLFFSESNPLDLLLEMIKGIGYRNLEVVST